MNPRIKKAFRDPLFACSLLLDHLGRFISDESFVKCKYFLYFHKILDLNNPQTYNQKLQWLKLYDRHDEYTQMVDKYEAKNCAASIIGDEYIIPTLGVYNSFDEINFDELPNQFVLKCTHDSGGVAICRDKTTFDYKAARKLLSRNLKRNKYWSSREYPYKDVKPRIIAEEYMEDESGYELKDYKFFFFGGEPRLIQLDFDRFSGHKKNLYTIQWELLPFSFNYSCHPECIFPKPNGLEKMVDIARKLSKGIPFIRVDLYNIKGKIYFGEITFFPASGMGKFQPEEWDYKLGEMINLPKR